VNIPNSSRKFLSALRNLPKLAQGRSRVEDSGTVFRIQLKGEYTGRFERKRVTEVVEKQPLFLNTSSNSSATTLRKLAHQLEETAAESRPFWQLEGREGQDTQDEAREWPPNREYFVRHVKNRKDTELRALNQAYGIKPTNKKSSHKCVLPRILVTD